MAEVRVLIADLEPVKSILASVTALVGYWENDAPAIQDMSLSEMHELEARLNAVCNTVRALAARRDPS